MSRRVLVVEDERLHRELLRELLEQECCQVRMATTAEDGLRLATTDRPNLILLDLQLPGMSGYEAARRLKADPATAAIPVVAVTAAAMRGDDRRALDAGCDAYLTKPLNHHMFREVLRRFLPGETDQGSGR